MCDLFHLSSPTFQDLPSQRAATTKTKELPEKEKNSVFCQVIHCLYKGSVLHCAYVLLHHLCGLWRPVYVYAVYLSVLESVPFTEKIKFSSTNMW